jgi:hypothetical protein
MSLVTKSMVSAAVVAFLGALACSGSSAVPQAVIAANVQSNGGSCSSPEQFLWIPNTTGTEPWPGPDPNSSPIQETGSSDPKTDVPIVIGCTVIPSASGGSPYNVTLTAQTTGGLTPATLTISGMFPARSRDMMGNPNADGTMIPNITGDYLDATKHLRQTNCFALYENPNNGSPGAAMPSVADTYADNSGGRIWASVFCPSPMNLEEMSKPGNSGCETSVVFRFENCSSQASSN